ncbi:DUF1624 domain-containing protein [Peptoniphilus sp. MSJ-1]|uniref:DUF1624 domain-containing protein n=1 Tax=Peptoniphilus ovalis TaxID=2841503 RepID=A0ABS6FH05_9FIRM|nr:heparan-alpha-glucosaminide N-acetyltransferase [Peptoniphilus ovalis]MBU5669457.1 DUF1624 domain-containing protein [Peptoniphilus ovalis]
MEKNKKRYNIIDFLRGFTIINMIIYHGIYDLEAFYGIEIPYNLYYYQQYICMSFILISGLSLNFSKNYFKKFLILTGVSIAITLATFLFDKNEAIYFGIIHFFAAAMLIHIIFENFIKKINPKFGLIICLILFIIFKRIYYGNIFFGLIDIPNSLYNLNLFVLGLPSPSFSSADYFPIIPWIFLFYVGYFFYDFIDLKKKEASKNIINIMGRHSLVLYIVHQIVLVVLLSIVFYFVGS